MTLLVTVSFILYKYILIVWFNFLVGNNLINIFFIVLFYLYDKVTVVIDAI